jgi:hypothetical protein
MLMDLASEFVVPKPAQELGWVPQAGQPHRDIERAAADVRARRRGVADDFIDKGFADYCEHVST